MKKRGIQSKVMGLASLLSIGGIALIAIVSIIGFINMRENTVKINDKLGTEAATGTENALENQALNQLQSLTTSKIRYADAKMQAVISQNLIISELAEDIFNNHDEYSEKITLPPLAENGGILSTQILYGADVDVEGVSEEAGKLGNLSWLLMQSTHVNSIVVTSQIGTESGFIIMGDTDAHIKTDIGNLDPRGRPWYVRAKEAGEMVWSDVIDDAFDRGLGIVCANPVYDSRGNLRGVVGVSAMLPELNSTIANEELGKTSYSFVLDQKGRMIVSPTMKKLEDGINMLESTLPDDRLLAEKMVAGESGVTRLVLNGVDVYAAYGPMEVLPWSICTVVEVDEILAPVHESADIITKMADAAKSDINRIILTVVIFFAVVVVASIATTYIMSHSFSRRITEPIGRLSLSISGIKDKNLQYISDIKTGDEIEDLSLAFENMSSELVTHIENLTRVTAEKERISAELDIATQIQADMLPSIFPAFPDRPEFDIYAVMRPAREVGGDFYDFFLIDDDHLAIVVADVSGKSVPAALFMVIAKTLINNRARAGEPPQDVFINVNRQLCEGNETSMFVTAWMGVLEISTGKMTYVNAGHNPPLLRKANGSFEYLKTKRGFVLAGMNGYRYTQQELKLDKGDMLFTYTDGVTEANNPANELYGEDRLQKMLNGLSELKPSDILPRVEMDIDLFADGAPQFDDITMMAILIN